MAVSVIHSVDYQIFSLCAEEPLARYANCHRDSPMTVDRRNNTPEAFSEGKVSFPNVLRDLFFPSYRACRSPLSDVTVRWSHASSRPGGAGGHSGFGSQP